MDRMYFTTDLFAKQWGELESLSTGSQGQRLSYRIRTFYCLVGQTSEKKRQQLQEAFQGPEAMERRTGPAKVISAHAEINLKDLQQSLALTSRKIYETAKYNPGGECASDERCNAAAHFVEDVLVQFKGMHRTVLVTMCRSLFRLEFASQFLGSHRETVMAAVQQDGLALQLACEYLQSDREVVMAAVRNKGLALQFASEKLQRDQEVITAAVQQDALARLFASDVSEKELVMATAQRDGLSHARFHSNRQRFGPPNSVEWYFHDVWQSNDVSFVDFYRTLKAFIDANQTDLSKSTSLLQLLDKSQKLQQAPSVGHFRV